MKKNPAYFQNLKHVKGNVGKKTHKDLFMNTREWGGARQRRGARNLFRLSVDVRCMGDMKGKKEGWRRGAHGKWNWKGTDRECGGNGIQKG